MPQMVSSIAFACHGGAFALRRHAKGPYWQACSAHGLNVSLPVDISRGCVVAGAAKDTSAVSAAAASASG